MIHIFEGVDLSGKSTKAQDLSSQLNIPIIKKKLDVFDNIGSDFLKSDLIERATRMFFESIYPLGKHYDFILDRSLLSTLVYCRYFERKFDTHYVYKYLLQKEYAQHIEVNLVIADENSIRQRYNTRGEKLFKIEQIIELQKIYFDISSVLLNNGCMNLHIIENNNADVSTL